MKRLLTVGVIVLFLGVAIAPSINADINKVTIEPIPDLHCEGELNWRNLTPNAIAIGYFVVENIGEEDSELDWEIESYPEWGNWSFTPDSGDNLTPFDGQVTIEVEVVAPDEITGDLGGMVKVINQQNPDDFCEIPVSWFVKSIDSELIEITTELYEQACSSDMPELKFISFKGPLGVTATIKNIGDEEVTNVELTLNITGGIFCRINKYRSVTQNILGIGKELHVKSGIIIGFGKISVIATASCAEGSPIKENVNGMQVFCFSLL